MTLWAFIVTCEGDARARTRLLAAHPDIDGVLAASDDHGLGGTARH